jgi:hypothetical protein
LNRLPVISLAKGVQALGDPEYLHHQKILMLWGTLQAGSVVFAMAISTLKPWKAQR